MQATHVCHNYLTRPCSVKAATDYMSMNECVSVPVKWYLQKQAVGFPGGAVVENPAANAGDTGSSPGLGRSHMPRSN